MPQEAKTLAGWCSYAMQLVEELPDPEAEQQLLLAELIPIQTVVYDRMISLLGCMEHADRANYEHIDPENSIEGYQSFLQQEEEMTYVEHGSETRKKLIILWAQFRHAHTIFETIKTNDAFRDLETAQRIVHETHTRDSMI